MELSNRLSHPSRALRPGHRARFFRYAVVGAAPSCDSSPQDLQSGPLAAWGKRVREGRLGEGETRLRPGPGGLAGSLRNRREGFFPLPSCRGVLVAELGVPSARSSGAP